MVQRCEWTRGGALENEYHDREWGVPVHEERMLFEYLLLGGAQAGLSWSTILRKREGYRHAFHDFDPQRIARYGKKQIARLMADPGIVRNRRKIEGAIVNARAVLELRAEPGGFDAFLWQFVGGRPIQNHWRAMAQVPATSPESDRMSKALNALGFKFVGSTICYAFMQAAGMVNDHTVDCFRWGEIGALGAGPGTGAAR